MMSRSRLVTGLPFVFWILSFVSIVIWTHWPGYMVGWDLNVYKIAMFSVRAGHDPYLACVAARKIYFDHLAAHPWAPIPFGYVYPPATVPLLRFLSKWSVSTIGVLYWAAYIAGVVITLWASTFAIRKTEWVVFVFLAPAVIFFPGLLYSDPVLSGNIAYIFYGLIFAGAVAGWRTGKWRWFYIAVLLASQVKGTFLSLLGIAVLTAACQWLPALGTLALSACCNVLQAWLWPIQFGHYRMALQSQVVDYVHDFGVHPAGILADALYDRVPYRITFVILYAICAVLLGSALIHLRGRFLRGEISSREWIPVALIGVTLMNPRIMQYDLLPVTLPMALVAWRILHRSLRSRRAVILAMSVGFVVLNVAANFMWVQTECLSLVGMMATGTWMLMDAQVLKSLLHRLDLRARTGELHINGFPIASNGVLEIHGHRSDSVSRAGTDVGASRSI